MAAVRVTGLGLALLLLAADLVSAQVQTKDQRKCTGATNKNFAQIARALGKDIRACIKDAAAGALAGTIEQCLVADRDQQVAKATQKTATDFTKLCTGTSPRPPMAPRRPPYGVTDPDTATATATEKQLELVHDVFGPDLDETLAGPGDDKNLAKCQRALAGRMLKCEQARLNEFIKCKQGGLKDSAAPFDGPEDLAACIGADPKGTVAKRCDLNQAPQPGKLKVDGIRKTLAKKCVGKGVNPAAALPGCDVADAEQAHACVRTAVACRSCLAINQVDGLERDCDLFDDGSANQSCLEAFVIGQHQCTLDADASAFLVDTTSFFHLGVLEGGLAINCGAVDPTTGQAECTCGVTSIDPVPIAGIGVACLQPASGCPVGEITCNGGGAFNGIMTSRHNIGACTGNADCAAQCATTCAANSPPFASACEGFCRGGASSELECSDDADCPGGTCNGVDATAHGNVCQCECLDPSGDPARPGALRCNVGIDIDIELAAPCGDGDVVFPVGSRCVPFTTETVQGTIVDANNVAGSQLPPGVEIAEGIPLTCADLATSASGLTLVSSVNVLDVHLAGDMAFLFALTCE